MKASLITDSLWVQGPSTYSYSSRSYDDSPELRWHRQRWDARTDQVNTHVAEQPLWQRTRSRMTRKRWWPARWRSAHQAEFLTLMIQLEFVEEKMMLPLELREAVGDLRKAAALWPETFRDMSHKAVQAALLEMRKLDVALRKISPRMSTVMTQDHRETQDRLEYGAKILKDLLRPKCALISLVHKSSGAAVLPAPTGIDLENARALGLSGDLIAELEAFLATTEAWKTASHSVELASKRNQVEYFISQINDAWEAMVADPVILKSTDAQGQFAEMVKASRERIQAVIHEAETGKVTRFMGTISALRLQLER